MNEITRSEDTRKIYAALLDNPEGLTLNNFRYMLGVYTDRRMRDLLSNASYECAVTQPIAVLGYVPHLGVYKIAEDRSEAKAIMANRAKRISSQATTIRKQAKAAEALFNVPEQQSLELLWEDAA